MLCSSAQTNCYLSYGSPIPTVLVVVVAAVVVAGDALVEAVAGVAVGLREAEAVVEVVDLQDVAVVEEEDSLDEHADPLVVVVEAAVVVAEDDSRRIQRLQ
jgi:hypothetical protein